MRMSRTSVAIVCLQTSCCAELGDEPWWGVPKEYQLSQALFPSLGQQASASAKGSSRSASSFFDEFTRVEIGHMAIGSRGEGL
jgi:hypothetical protein